MDRTFLAVHHQMIRLAAPLHFVCDELEHLGTIDPRDDTFHIRLGEGVPGLYVYVTHKDSPVLVGDAPDLYSIHCHRDCAEIHSLPAVQRRPGVTTHPRFQVCESHGAVLRSLPPPVYDDVYAPAVKAHHIVLIQLRLYVQIQKPAVGNSRRPAEHIHTLTEEIPYIVDLIILPVIAAQIHPDHYVRPERPCLRHREIVPHTAIHKHHPVHLDRGEHSRDGHCGPEGGGHLSRMPEHPFAFHQIGRHACEGHWQTAEQERILIAHGKSRYEIVDILSLDIT